MLRIVLLAALACALPGLALANGACNATARSVSGTYGFAAQGIATADTMFAPAGPFAQSGTVTQVATVQTPGTISGM